MRASIAVPLCGSSLRLGPHNGRSLTLRCERLLPVVGLRAKLTGLGAQLRFDVRREFVLVLGLALLRPGPSLRLRALPIRVPDRVRATRSQRFCALCVILPVVLLSHVPRSPGR